MPEAFFTSMRPCAPIVNYCIPDRAKTRRCRNGDAGVCKCEYGAKISPLCHAWANRHPLQALARRLFFVEAEYPEKHHDLA